MNSETEFNKWGFTFEDIQKVNMVQFLSRGFTESKTLKELLLKNHLVDHM